jgi:hypothetical protein
LRGDRTSAFGFWLNDIRLGRVFSRGES